MIAADNGCSQASGISGPQFPCQADSLRMDNDKDSQGAMNGIGLADALRPAGS